jgi:hypothetical protein
MSEEPKKRGRPPGAKNKPRAGRPKLPMKSKRVEARNRASKGRAKGKRPKRPPVEEVQAEIVLPGEEFGSRPSVDYEPEEPAANAQYALLFPRPRGRPPGSTLLRPDEPTLSKIWDLGVGQATQAEVAVGLGVSLKTLQRFFDDYEVARDTFEDARTAGQGSLRQHFYREAMTGNTPVLLRASEHLLGMHNRPKDDGAGKNTVPLDTVEAAADDFRRQVADFITKKEEASKRQVVPLP